MIRIGTAGWTIPKDVREAFSGSGSHLERYARVFSCAEINSTFYRSHRKATYERWAGSVPDDFRFSLKIPKTITHDRRLVAYEEPLKAFLDETAVLERKRAALLVQLPPSLAFDERQVAPFLQTLRNGYDGEIACEPRHPSWFEAPAEKLLRAARVARVAADPAVVPAAARPGAYQTFAYYRWHGAPRVYYSSYGAERIPVLAASLDRTQAQTWCVFDNTALGAATADALLLREFIAPEPTLPAARRRTSCDPF